LGSYLHALEEDEALLAEAAHGGGSDNPLSKAETSMAEVKRRAVEAADVAVANAKAAAMAADVAVRAESPLKNFFLQFFLLRSIPGESS